MLSRFPCVNLKKTGQNIAKLMQENNLSVKDLQETFGFEYPQAIYKWLRGQSLPSLDNLVVLAKLFHTFVDTILVIDE